MILCFVAHLSNYSFADTGLVPEEISNLTNLRALDICHNRFSGSIPDDIFKLSSLVDLRFLGNCAIEVNAELLCSRFSVAAQMYLLTTLYLSTKGHQWNHCDGWAIGSSNLTLWHGVMTDWSSGHIVELDLHDNNLQGAIFGIIRTLEFDIRCRHHSRQHWHSSHPPCCAIGSE